jgi:hypothetical protein
MSEDVPRTQKDKAKQFCVFTGARSGTLARQHTSRPCAHAADVRMIIPAYFPVKGSPSRCSSGLTGTWSRLWTPSSPVGGQE